MSFSENEIKHLKMIYEGLLDHGLDLPPFSEWVSLVMLVLFSESGGLVFLRDNEIPGLWWIDIYEIGSKFGIHHFKACLILCKSMGCEVLAAKTLNRGGQGILKKLGFQQFDEDIFSIKMRGCEDEGMENFIRGSGRDRRRGVCHDTRPH